MRLVCFVEWRKPSVTNLNLYIRRHTDLFINKKLNVFGPVAMAPMTELICGHLAIWRKPDIEDASNERRRTRRGLQYELNVDVALEAAMNDTTAGVSCPSPHFLKIHGTCVEDAWGFVGNFLDWKKLKDRSDIYGRFADCNLEFRLSRVGGSTVEGIDMTILAQSPDNALLDEENSVVVTTESLHGTWENRVGNIDGWGGEVFVAVFAVCLLTRYPNIYIPRFDRSSSLTTSPFRLASIQLRGTPPPRCAWSWALSSWDYSRPRRSWSGSSIATSSTR